jgi:hypothetical protein
MRAGGIKVAQETADDELADLAGRSDPDQAEAVTILKNDQALLNQARIEKIYAGGS